MLWHNCFSEDVFRKLDQAETSVFAKLLRYPHKIGTCCTAYVLHCLRAALLTCCTAHVLHCSRAALLTCCTAYVLHCLRDALLTCWLHCSRATLVYFLTCNSCAYVWLQMRSWKMACATHIGLCMFICMYCNAYISSFLCISLFSYVKHSGFWAFCLAVYKLRWLMARGCCFGIPQLSKQFCR